MLKKGILPLALSISALLMITTCSVGCAKQEEQAGSGKKLGANESSVTGSTKTQVVSIKHYIYQDENTLKYGKLPQQIGEFQKQNPGIHVEILPLVDNTSADEFTKKQDLMLASGEQMDVLYFKDVQALTAKLQSKVVEPLDGLALKMGVNLKGEYRGLIPFNGLLYAFPSQYSTWVTYINKDMLDAAKLEPPPADWTWEDYRYYAGRLTKGVGEKKVYGSYMHSWEWFNAVGYQNKIIDNPFYKKDGSANFDDPIFRIGLKYRYDLETVDKSQIPYIDILTQKIAYRSVFFSGKVAMMPQGTWMLTDINNKEKFPHTFKTILATYPRADKDSPVNFSNNGGSGCGYGINANSKFKEETFKYLYFLTTKGNDIGRTTLSPWKKADTSGILKGLIGSDDSLFDMNSLLKILNDPNKKDNDYTISPYFGVDVSNIFLEESQKYFLGVQTLDECIANLQIRSNEVITKAKNVEVLK